MEILKIVEELQSYTEDMVAYKLDSRFACAVTEAVKLLVEQERRKHEQTKEDRESAEARARDAEQNVIDMQQRLSAAKSSEEAWQKEIDKLNDDRKKAEQAELDTQKKVEELQKQLQEAQSREESVRADLKKTQDNPNIPESMMEQLRQEAETAAAEKATENIRKKLEEAEQALKASEEKTQAVEAELMAAQKRLKMADVDVMEYNTLAQKLMNDYNVLDGLRRKITVHDREVGEKLKQFQTKMVTMFADSLEGTR